MLSISFPLNTIDCVPFCLIYALVCPCTDRYPENTLELVCIVYKAEPFPEFIQNIIAKGGLLNYIKE
ncbi:MAG: hypothetical protein ACI4I4_00235 [Acutalibacteraceae bacterium]